MKYFSALILIFFLAFHVIYPGCIGNFLTSAGNIVKNFGSVQKDPNKAREARSVHFHWLTNAASRWRLSAPAHFEKPESKGFQDVVKKQDNEVNTGPETNFQQEITAFGVIDTWQLAALVITLILTAALAACVFFCIMAEKVDWKPQDRG